MGSDSPFHFRRPRLILSLCDYSGVWSQPYEDDGYDVVKVDLRDGEVPLRSPVISAWFRGSTAPGSASNEAESCGVPTRMSNRCSSKPPGACADPLTRASPRFGAGNRRLNADAAKRSRSSRWRDSSHAFSTRCGETAPTISRRRFARITRGPAHSRRLCRVGPMRSSSWRSKRVDVPGRV